MSSEIAPLLPPLAAAQRLLARFGDEGLIIGGVAVALLGAPRLTVDVVIVLLLGIQRLPELLFAAAAEGLAPRIAGVERFARQNRVLLLRHEESGVNVDISLGMLPFEAEAVARGVTRRVGSLDLRLPTPEDLIIMKGVAHRPKDLLDIQGIATAQPELDRPRVAYWLRQFADTLEMPQLWTDVEAILGS